MPSEVRLRSICPPLPPSWGSCSSQDTEFTGKVLSPNSPWLPFSNSLKMEGVPQFQGTTAHLMILWDQLSITLAGSPILEGKQMGTNTC